MFIQILLFAFGLVLLIRGGDWFVDSASSIARRLHMPELLIGATVVSIGTTLPETMVSTQGALLGRGSIAFGNAIGSIICNTALIAALTLVVRPPEVSRKALLVPSGAFFLAAAFFCFNAYAFGSFSRLSGIVLLSMFALYIAFVARTAMRHKPGQTESPAPSPASAAPSDTSLLRDVLILCAGAVVIAVGARLLVSSTQVIALAMGIPESVIALTLIALGTSLPELITAITSLRKGLGSLSLGNVIGANLFNLVLVCGLAITVAPFDLTSASASSMTVDIPLMLGVMLLLVVPALLLGRMRRWQGVILLLTYAGYCGYQFFFV